MNHIQRIRNLPSRGSEHENNYNVPQYSEKYQVHHSRQHSNRGSVNIQHLSERGVEYESPNKYRPSAAAMQQYKLHEARSQLSSAAIGSHTRVNSGLQAQQHSYANNRNGVISAAGLRELRQII